MTPETRYAKGSDGVAIAYQVVGDGAVDLVWVPGWVSHVEAIWEEPTAARFLERLASFSRLILFDKRGTGLSDRVAISDLPTMEQRMADLVTVCDAVDAQQPALVGISEGAPLSILFAATFPRRTKALILLGGFARESAAPGHPWGNSDVQLGDLIDEVRRDWGGPIGLESRAPSMAHNERFRANWARFLRLGASPAAVIALAQMNASIDVRPALPACTVPTLVIHRTGDRAVPVESGRFLAEGIPGARLVELPGVDHLPWVGDVEPILGEIEEFLTGIRHTREPERALTTVLFTDVVGSTEIAAGLGDRAWSDLLASHHTLVREVLARFDGHEIGTAGDGFFATFDGPARAIRCALEITQSIQRLGLEIRCGIHTGEVELTDDDGVRGLAVHIGARIGALAGPGEVLVSRTVKDLVAGSGLEFRDRGTHVLKGVPDSWQVYAVGT